MAGASTVLQDKSILSQWDRGLLKLESAFALLSGLAVFALIVLAVISVSGRNFFNQPVPGYVDWIEQIMPLVAFMGISYTQRNGGHVRMDLFVGLLKRRWLWGVELITTLIILLVMILLVYGTYTHFLRSFDFAAPLWSRDSSMDISIPLWPAKLLAPLAFSVICVRLCLQICGFTRAFMQNAHHPVAVPLIEDAVTRARSEADSVGMDETEADK